MNELLNDNDVRRERAYGQTVWTPGAFSPPAVGGTVSAPAGRVDGGMAVRVVLNATPLAAPLTGVGRYTYALAGALAGRPGIEYTYYYQRAYLAALPVPGVPVVDNPPVLVRWRRRLLKKPLLGELAGRAYAVLRGMPDHPQPPDPFDVYFEPNFIVQDLPAKRVVVTVHDLTFVHHPEWMSVEGERYFRENFFPRIGRADLIVTPSGSVAEELRQHPQLHGFRVAPVYNGIDHAVFCPGQTGAVKADSYILFVGTVEPRKNILCLLRAFRMLPESSRREFKLVLAGAQGWKNEAVRHELETMADRVTYTGYIDDGALVELYRGAAALVCPSFYEGFSFPPVEAMACGTPVLASDIPVHREVCAGAALYFNPYEPEELAGRLAGLLQSPSLAGRMAAEGLARAAVFSWERAAGELAALFAGLH